jgi:type IV secretory pathway VirB9-like protein
MRKLLALLTGTVLSTQAWALDACRVSSIDPQDRICTYSPEQRYLVTGLVGFPVNLRFGDTERVKRAEFAYTGTDKDGNPTQSWRGPPTKAEKGEAPALTADRFKTSLPIWPFAEGRSALLVVTQMPDGSERSYQFALISRKAGDCAKGNDQPGCMQDVATTSSLSFEYPADVAAAAAKAAAEEKAAGIAAWQAKQKTADEQAAVARLKTDVFYGERNWAYQIKAEKKWAALAPDQVSDNGWLTVMRWPENVEIPSVTVIDPVTGQERTANSSKQGRLVIIPTTAQRLRLRIGNDAVADVINLHWSAERPNPDTGTTSPEVVRTVVMSDGKPQ